MRLAAVQPRSRRIGRPSSLPSRKGPGSPSSAPVGPGARCRDAEEKVLGHGKSRGSQRTKKPARQRYEDPVCASAGRDLKLRSARRKDMRGAAILAHILFAMLLGASLLSWSALGLPGNDTGELGVTELSALLMSQSRDSFPGCWLPGVTVRELDESPGLLPTGGASHSPTSSLTVLRSAWLAPGRCGLVGVSGGESIRASTHSGPTALGSGEFRRTGCWRFFSAMWRRSLWAAIGVPTPGQYTSVVERSTVPRLLVSASTRSLTCRGMFLTSPHSLNLSLNCFAL